MVVRATGFFSAVRVKERGAVDEGLVVHVLSNLPFQKYFPPLVNYTLSCHVFSFTVCVYVNMCWSWQRAGHAINVTVFVSSI